MTDALTPEGLKRVEAFAASFPGPLHGPWGTLLPYDIRALLAELRRLQSVEARAVKVLNQTYDIVQDVVDRIEDEGDRSYLGSTNDADSLRFAANRCAALYGEITAPPTGEQGGGR